MSKYLRTIAAQLLFSYHLSFTSALPNFREGFLYLGNAETSNGRNFIVTDYFITMNTGSWETCQSDCQNEFGEQSHLISIESETEQLLINTWLEDHISFGVIWTGGLYDLDEKVWKWAGSGANISYTNWDKASNTDSVSGVDRIALNFRNRLNSYWAIQQNTALYRCGCEYLRSKVVTVGTSTLKTPLSANNSSKLIMQLNPLLYVLVCVRMVYAFFCTYNW